MEKKPVGRFAPTPSGRMHLGNVFAFMIAWLSVKSRDGSIVLRMEDLDTQRTSAEFAQILREDLLWLVICQIRLFFGIDKCQVGQTFNTGNDGRCAFNAATQFCGLMRQVSGISA